MSINYSRNSIILRVLTKISRLRFICTLRDLRICKEFVFCYVSILIKTNSQLVILWPKGSDCMCIFFVPWEQQNIGFYMIINVCFVLNLFRIFSWKRLKKYECGELKCNIFYFDILELYVDLFFALGWV